MKISHIDYSDLSEVARTKSGKRAAVKSVRKQATTKSVSSKCKSGKRRLKDHKHAVHTLHKAKSAGQTELINNGSTKRRETRTYFCDRCNGHHLTSLKQWSTFSGQVAA